MINKPLIQQIVSVAIVYLATFRYVCAVADDVIANEINAPVGNDSILEDAANMILGKYKTNVTALASRFKPSPSVTNANKIFNNNKIIVVFGITCGSVVHLSL